MLNQDGWITRHLLFLCDRLDSSTGLYCLVHLYILNWSTDDFRWSEFSSGNAQAVVTAWLEILSLPLTPGKPSWRLAANSRADRAINLFLDALARDPCIRRSQQLAGLLRGMPKQVRHHLAQLPLSLVRDDAILSDDGLG